MRERPSRFEVRLLEILRDAGRPLYGVPIGDRLGEDGHRLSYGRLYVTLHRLDELGLVRSRDGEATAERGWRRKRYYEPTDRGLAALAACTRPAEREPLPWWRRFPPRPVAG